MDADDARPATGGDRPVAVVAHRPVGAAVLDLAARARGESRVEGEYAAGRTGAHGRHVTVEARVDAAAEGQHGDDGEYREQRPLQPTGERCREGRQSREDR